MNPSDHIEPSSSKVRKETGENEPVLNSHDVLETLLSIMKNMEINVVRSWHSKLHQPIRLQNNHIIQQYVKSFIIPKYLMDSIKGLTSSHVVKIAAFFEKQFYCESETFELYRTSSINFNQILTAFVNLIKLSRETYQKKKGIRFSRPAREEGSKEESAPILNVKEEPSNEKELDEPSNGPNRCSRVFILYALRKLRERARKGTIREVLTTDKEILNACVKETFHQCQNSSSLKDDHATYGGSCFSITDNSTYWTNGDQLLDWWVKNIENKQVLSLLVQNASYNGQRVKKFQKKHWSEAVIEVVTELKQLQHKDAEVTNSSIIKPVVSTESNKNSSSVMDYVQRSQVNSNSSSNSNTVNVGGINLTMPAEKLHHVFFLFQLHDALVNESSQILGFNENNTVFTINDIDTFTKVIMPKYFKDMTFDAFQNQLNQLHFSIMRNPNSCYYYQRLFQKNRKDLIQQIPDSSSTPLSTYSNDLASNANKTDQNQRSNTASIAPSNASSNLSLSAVGSTSQSANNPADFLMPNAITHLPVQQQIMQVQSQLIALIYNSILTNSLSNGAGGTPAWNNSALASLLPSISSAPVAFPLPEPYNSTQSFPGFQQGNFNAYNPWLNNFQPTLSGLYQHLQQQSTIPSVQSMPNNGNNLAQLGHNPSFGPLNAPYPSYAKANQTIPGNTALPATSNSLLPNSNLTPNNGMFHGAETLSSIQLPNLTNVTMASKMANEIAMNNGSSHLRLNQPSSNPSNASWYQQQKGLLGDMRTDSFNKNSYLRTYEPAKESTDAGSSDGLKVDVKSKKRSNAAVNGSATASARASDDNSSEDASNPRNKRRKKASRTNSTTISDKILRSIPAPILSHALVQSSLAFNRSQQLDDDSELEEELHSLEPGEDEEEDEHRYRSGKNQKNSRRSSSGKKGTKEQDTLTTNTALKAAVKGSYEDIIDLRKVGRKRIFVDFTLKASQTSDTQHFPAALFTSVDASHPNNSSKEKNDDFICGFFHGKLIPNDECTIYKFGNVRSSSGRILGSGDDNNTYISNDGNGSFTSSSLASADRSEESRVGSEYQAEIPEFFSRKQLVQNRPKDIESNRVWLCSAIDEEELENIVEVLFERKKNWIPTVGLVYTIYFPNAEDGQSRYRLCAVLEALTVSSSARGRKSRGTSASFRVHDGKSEETITLDQFVRSLHKDEESLLDFIHEKQYDAEDVLENYDLDRIGSDEYESFHFKWTMKEVEQFLIGFRKYHEIRRIWQVYFQSSKTYQEIVKFYHDIHPYLMDNRIEAFMTMYYYAEAAKLQVPVETYLDNSTILGTASKNFPISVIEGGAYSTRSRRQYMKSSNIEEALNPPTSNSAVNSKPNPAAGVATTKQVPSLARNNDKYPTIIASNGHFGTLSLVFDTNYIFPERGTRNQQPSSQGKDGKGKTSNSSSSQVDERSLPIATYFGRRMFCICRTPINDTDRYIRCKVAKPSNCNGWVHMTCAGFGHLIDATVKKQPSKFREYICVKCKETLENEVVTKDDSTEQD